MDETQLEHRLESIRAAIRRLNEPIEYDRLSDDVHQTIAALEIKVMDLEFEAKFYRAATLIAFALLAERLWARFFG